MMPLTRSALVRMISVRRRSSLGELRRFRQQLARMAHGADRIADLVRDAGAQPAEGREFGLLDLLLDQARVLEEDQHRARGSDVAERREVRADHARAVGGDEGLLEGGDHAGAVGFLRHVSRR